MRSRPSPTAAPAATRSRWVAAAKQGRRAARAVWLAAMVAGALTHAGCGALSSGGGADGGDGDLAHAGVIVATYTRSPDNPRVRAQLTVSAWFAEHAWGELDRVLDLLNTPALASHAPPALGECRAVTRAVPGRGDDVEAVYFMDAGDLTVVVGDERQPLDGHYFPDVFPQVAGLVYDGVIRDDEAAGPHTMRVVGHGSGAVGPFDVTVPAPAPLGITSVIARGSTQGPGTAGGLGGAVEVRWTPSERGEDGQVLIELVRRGFDRVATITCAAEDTGRFVIDGALVASLPSFGADQTDRLHVSRVSEEAFEAPGLDDGRAVLLARDSVFLN